MIGSKKEMHSFGNFALHFSWPSSPVIHFSKIETNQRNNLDEKVKHSIEAKKIEK